MAHSIVYRDCKPADAPLLLQLWKDAGATPSSTDNEPAVLNLLTYPHAVVLLACAGPKVVGSLIASSDGWRANMYRLAVLPDFRRKGIAGSLVREAERRLREKGITRFTALVESGHSDAIGLWESAGYEHYQGIRRYAKNLT
jgi:ribosomal protein S18 acetylase RimI-like enzyme